MRPDPLEETRLRKQLEKLNECLMNGRFDVAREGFERLIAEHPGHPQALHGLGVLAVHEGRLDEGERLLREALTHDADNARFWNDLGEALRLQERFQDAIIAYRKALELAADFAPAANNLGVVLAMTGAFEEAEKQFLAALERFDDDPFAWNNLGVLRQQMGRFEEALVAYETAVRLKPDFAEALANYRELLEARPDLTADAVRRIAELLGVQQDESERITVKHGSQSP